MSIEALNQIGPATGESLPNVKVWQDDLEAWGFVLPHLAYHLGLRHCAWKGLLVGMRPGYQCTVPFAKQ